jgi:uncharacterized protein
MRVIRQSEYRVMPWKNGGGTTTEIYLETSGHEDFDWRASIASVNSDGPFSSFAGYERHIMLIGGNGMTLDLGGHDKIVLQPLQPFTFSGDKNASGVLLSGGVLDFNLIVRNDFGTGLLCSQMSAEPAVIKSRHGIKLVHVLHGDSYLLEEGEQMRFPDSATLIVCSVRPRSRPLSNA